MLKTAPVRPTARSVAPVAAALVAIFALSLSGCGLLPEDLADTAQGAMGAKGLVLEVAGATLSLAPGAVPEGTQVSLSLDSASGLQTGAATAAVEAPRGKEVLVPASGRVAVKVGAPLAQGATMSLGLAVVKPADSDTFTPSAATLALSHTASDATPATDAPSATEETQEALSRVAFTPEQGGHVSASVLAGGVFQLVHADVAALLQHAAAATEQTMAATRAPDCSGQTVTAAGAHFSVQAPEGAWTCLSEANGLLQVALTTKVPLRLATSETPTATTLFSDPAADSDGSYFHQILRPLTDYHQGLDGAAPGAAAAYQTAAADVEHVSWELQPYPALFLLQYLAALVEATLDQEAAVEAGKVDASRTAQCLAPVMEIHKEHSDLAPPWAGPFTQEFFKCVAGSLLISPRMDVLLGAINAVPEDVADTAVKLWQELSPSAGTLTINGQLQWVDYSTTLNGVRVAFSHPAAWTVMDSSVNQQFAQPHTLMMYDHAGHRKATLTVSNQAPSAAAQESYPVELLGAATQPSRNERAVLMDLSEQPQLQTLHGWSNKVRVVQSFAGPQGPTPDKLSPSQLVGSVPVKSSAAQQKFVSFSHATDFATLAQARAHAQSRDFATVGKMVASFTG